MGGPDPAPVWLDCARDLTEYWVHQQQVRAATGRPGGRDPATVHAVLETFLRAMPHTLRRLDRSDGSTLAVVVPGEAGGRWGWRRGRGRWWPADPDGAGTVVTVEADVLWRLCVRMIEPAQARARVTGDRDLAAAALRIVSIIR